MVGFCTFYINSTAGIRVCQKIIATKAMRDSIQATMTTEVRVPGCRMRQ